MLSFLRSFISSAPTEERQQIFIRGPSSPYDPTVRSDFSNTAASISAWPSRGGLIRLDDAEAIDFSFLGLDPLNSQPNRDSDQSSEDAYAQQLLLLGAKWWDSKERCFVVDQIEALGEGTLVQGSIGHGDGSFRSVEHPRPTM